MRFMSEPRRLTREERKQDTRQRLVEAAARVFGEFGFDAASLDQVAEAAGFTKGAVYSNFRDKTDLFMAIIERRVEEQVGSSLAALRGMTLRQALSALDGTGGEGGEFDPRWLMLVAEFWLHAMRHPEARALLASEYARARAITTELIATKYAESGETPPMPPRELAIIMEALGIGLGFQASIDPAAVSMGLQGKALARILGSPADESPTAGSASGAPAPASAAHAPDRGPTA